MSISYSQLEELLKRLPGDRYPAAWDTLSRLVQGGPPQYPPIWPTPAAPPPVPWVPGYPAGYYPAPAPPPPSSRDPFTAGDDDDDDDGQPGGSELCEDPGIV